MSGKLEDTDELAAFRSQWKEELGIAPKAEQAEQSGDDEEVEVVRDASNYSTPPYVGLTTSDKQSPPDLQLPEDGDSSAHKEAMRLYWMGVAAEESGDMSGAIMYYRQAVQLHPEVDWEALKQGPPSESEEGAEECESDLFRELVDDFNLLSIRTFCQPRKPAKGVHISALPVEVLRYVLRWVASAQLDMRAIEQVAKVCKGFYLLAREPQLWKCACRKVWGESSHPGAYGSWRRMFILKPHLHFNGVYISKTSYVREGEHSVDGFYKPYHTVTYYRFLRFFPDGCVMYQTTPEEPAQVVGKLCHRHSSESVLLGSYHVQDRTVVIELLSEQPQGGGHQQQHQAGHRGTRGRGGRNRRPEQTHKRTFHMELQLVAKLKTNQLTWIQHYCSTLHIGSGQEQVTHFPINYMYTPFHFSRVKSYTLNSMGLLQ